MYSTLPVAVKMATKAGMLSIIESTCSSCLAEAIDPSAPMLTPDKPKVHRSFCKGCTDCLRSTNTNVQSIRSPGAPMLSAPRTRSSSMQSRSFLTTALAAACGLVLLGAGARTLKGMTMTRPLREVATQAPAAPDGIRPFRVHVSDEALTDLRRRIQATRWPDRETVPDQSQGAQLARLQPLVQYWGSGYDWRKAEAQLNALPQF